MFCIAFSWASVFVPEMVQQSLVQLQAVKPDFLTPEKWEPKVVKKRDRQNGTFEVLWEEMVKHAGAKGPSQ